MIQDTILRIDLDLTDGNRGPSAICRNLLAEGVSPKQHIEFWRGDTLCFTAPVTVGGWARIDPRESHDGRHMRFVPFEIDDEAHTDV